MTKRILIALLVALGLMFAGASSAGGAPDRSWCVMDGLTVVKDDMTQDQAERMAARTGLVAERGLICDYQPAALRADSTPFVLQVPGSITQDARVASLWSKTAADMVVGSCSGAGCIAVRVVDAPCGGGYLGCAYGWNYAQGCTVEVNQWVLDWSRQYDLPDFEFNVLGHEVGHCVIGSAWHDASAERSIMYATLHYGDRARGLTKAVKDQVAARLTRL